MVIFVNDDKDILPGDIKTFSSAEMGTIYKSDFDYEKGRPKPKPYDVSQTGYGGGAVNRIMRAGEDFYQSSYEAMKGFEVAYGQAKVAYGKHFAGSDSADEWIESGKALQQAALRDLEIRRKEYEENKTYLPPQVENSTSQGIINAAVQYLPQIPIAYASGGVGPVIIVGAQSFGGAEAEGIMTAAKRGQLEEFLGQPENELTLNAFRGVTNAALEKVGGVFEQIKIAQKLKKLNSPTPMNKLVAAGEVGLKAGVSEGITEALQGVSDIYYDSLLNRFENDAELKDAFEQNIKGAFYAMAIAAPIGTAGNIYYRRKAKQNIIDGLSQTDMTETEKERFADAFVQKQMIDGQTAAVKAVDYSEQLRNKHGEIYDALYGAIAKAADDAGAYVDLNETQKAQLLSDTARRFSDEAIAESVKRNTSVENVINAKEIKYVGNGAFQLEDTKGSSDNTTKESGNKLPAGQTDETTTSTTNTSKTNNNSDVVNKENENILYQGQIAENNRHVELTINSTEETQGLEPEDFKNKMINTLKSFKGKKIFNPSLNGNIEIRTSSIKKYKSFFADKNKRLIVPYIPELLGKAKFTREESYTKASEPNIKAYYKADLPIHVDEVNYNVHLTVREDQYGNFFWDAQVKGEPQHATSATNPRDTGLTSETSEDGLSITRMTEPVNKENENILYQEEVELGNPIDLTETFSNVRGKTPEQTAQHVEEYLNNLIKKGGMETATKPLQVQVTKGNKAHVVRSNIGLNSKQQKRHNTALLTLEKIINNAIRNSNRDGTVDLTHNTNQKTLKHKSKVERYVYFDSPVRINNQDYTVSLTTEQVKGQDQNLLNLYNVHVKRGMLPMPNLKTDSVFTDHPSLNSNITRNGGPVNRENENILYQEDIELANRSDPTKYLTDTEVQAVEKDAKDFATHVQKMIDGELSPYTRLVVLNKLPSAYNNIPELKGKKLVINQNIYKKIIDLPNPYKNHNVDRKRAVKIPYLVADPNYILNSTSKGHEDRFVVITNSRGNKKGERLSIFIQPDTNAAVVSGYDEIVDISKEKKEGRVLYDKKKELSKTHATSKATSIDNSNSNITRNGDPVNRENENILEHQPRSIKRASYDRNSRVIQLLQDATPASLPHEFAHYWLDNITAYVNSGQASDTYLNTFYQPIIDYLGQPKWSNGFSRAQHEKFAAGYEKYLYNGNLPTPILGSVFDDYDKWLKDVYASAEAITISGTTKKPVLTPEIIAFFRSMTTGKLETAPALKAIAQQAENQQIAKEAVETEAKARAYVQAETEAFNTTSESSTDPAIDVQNALRTIDAQTQAEAKARVEATSESKQKTTIQPIQGPGETAGTRYYERVKERLGLTDADSTGTDALERNRMSNADEQAKAASLWRTNPERAQQILDSGDMSNEVLRNALYTEYQKIMLASGNMNAWHESVQQQSWEATRAGQEIQYLRVSANDITDPAYWVRQTESNLTDALANKMSTVLSGDPNKSRPQQLALELDKDIQVLTQKILDADPKDRNKLFQEELTRLQKKYAGNQQNKVKQVVLPEFSAEKQGRKYIEKQAKEAIGIVLTADQTNTIIQKAQTIDKLFKKTDALGLPDVDFFKAVKDLENYVNGIMPSGTIKVLTSIIGRAGMLSSPATYVMNGVSNAVNLVDTTLTHRLKNIMTGHTNDTIVDKNLVDAYKQKIKDVFWETGQDITLMDSFVDDILYRGEKLRTHAQGAGFIRWLGRAAEKLVFQRMMSHPDTVFRARTYFTNILNNEATQQAYQEGLTGDTAKQRANSLFIEATHLQPQSEEARMIRQKARAESLYATFQQDSLLSETLLGLREKINKGLDTVGLGGAADAMFPFVKTPANVIDSGLDALFGPFRNPKNLIGALQDKRAGLTAQESKRIDKAVRSTAHMIPGWILAILAVSLLDDDDYIPDYLSLSAKDRKIIQEKAGAFGAIKVGNYWMNTDYLGSLEIPLTAFLEYKNANAVWDNLRSMAGGVITKAIDTPVIREIADTIEALKQVPGGRAKIDDVLTNSLGNYITAAVPNILNTLAKSLDDYERDTERDVWKKIEAKIPGFRESLKPKTSEITGKPIQTQHWLITTLFGSRVHTDS